MRRLTPPPLTTPGARPWVRAAWRRPGRGLALVIGVMAMTVATVASLVAADSLERLFVEDAKARWGVVDVVTFQPGNPLIGASTATFAATQALTAEGDRWASRLLLDGVLDSGTVATQPLVTVIGVSADEQVFADPLTGNGQTDPLWLGPEEVVVNRRLAERAGVAVGDRVPLVLSIPEHTDPDEPDITHDPRVVEWRPTVAGVADHTGVADFGRTANVVTRLDTLQRITDLPNLVSALHVAVPEAGRDAAEAVTARFESINRRLGLVSVEAKEDALAVAADEGGLFSGILLTLALLVVAAAAAVTANLVVLLGQERAPEVAVLRSMGARRGTVAGLFVAEALTYTVVGAIVGAGLAVPLAGWLAAAIADNFASIEAGRGRELVALDLTADPVTVLIGLAVVVAVAWTTSSAAARRSSEMPLAEVLRGGPPVLPSRGPSARRLAITRGTGLLVLGMGITASDGGDLLRVLGISLLLVAWWLRRRADAGRTARRRLDERAAWLGLAFSVAAPAVAGDFSKGVQSSFGILTLAGVGATVCATVLAGARMRDIMRIVRLYLPGQRLQAPLRTAGAHAGRLRSRGGTITGTVAVVLFMIASLNVLGSATDIGVARQRGGYDVVGTSVVPVDPDQLGSTRGAVRVDALDHTVLGETWFSVRDEDDDEVGVPYPVRAIRIEAGFPGVQRFTVVEALPAYTSSTQLLEDVMRGEGVVLDRYARPEGANPGDDVVIDDGRGPVSYPLLGVLDTFVLQGVLMGADDYDDLLSRDGPTFLLAAASSGHDPAALAGAMNEAASDRGLVASPVAEAAAEVVAVNRAFTDTFAIMLRLALGIALLAVAVLVARAVRERRGQLAVLRAVGFRRRDVVATLVAEPLLQAVVGIVIGVGVGLGVLWLLFLRGFADLAFVVDWRSLGGTSAGVAVLVGVAAAIPAWRGSRVGVADGLRDLG